ncbi:hypothetical protein EDD90_6763 [Streptomyces sp. Ag109_O5-1]|uniref:hypothetical protein n=1 Tax=Streptomyces sp. Ag109_O5-1 TaxID=1938851 RepID=UPI000F505638|nr:hypothetical protein [Streptomyces sp. Ag109_O5-1]RPE43558.1 hypothetical protein EDD90_6763 [Streptomyces sp. Ag109_O5-1]
MPVEQQHSDSDPFEPFEPFERELSAALHHTGGDFDTDRAALAAAGTARGRRLRQRRRAAVLGGATGVALVGVGGALAVPWGGSSSVARPPSSVSTTPHATSSPAGHGVTSDEMIRTLERLLPKGKFSKAEGRGVDENDPLVAPYAQVVYDDGHGAAAISVAVNRVLPGGNDARQAVQCPDKVYIPYDSCVPSHLPDASVVTVTKGYEYPDRRVDTKLWTANLVTPDGHHVSVSEWNAAAEKDAPISREEPPLSAAQLKELAAAKDWRGVVDAIPEDPRQTQEPPAAQENGKGILQTLTSLIPKGLKVVAHGSADDSGFTYVVVDDGKGRSLVQINVQPDMSDVADDLFGRGSETLSDGTKVAERQGPGEKGGDGVVMWTVDTLRTDGFRVVVSAFNSGSQQTAATRKAPALSMKQLRAIALSPTWHA